MMRCLGRVATILVLIACRDVTTNIVSDPDAAIDGGGGTGGTAGAGGAGGAAGADAAMPVDAARGDAGARCGGRTCECDDGLDNDADGLVDGFDDECTGPRDEDESSFATGTPNPPGPCRDCFWDDNAGNDDGCWIPAACLADPNFLGGPNCPSCVPDAVCIDTCRARTPNGCDCFGCCEVTQQDGSKVEIVLEDSCSLAKLDDVFACPRCTRNTECLNPCGECELCPGKEPGDLPASCGSGQPGTGVGHACDNGLQTCSESMPCQGTDYCKQGCCLLTVF